MNFIHEKAVVIGDVKLGEECSVWPCAVIRGDRNSIKLGKCCCVQDNAVIHTDSNHKVEIGEYVTIGHGAVVHGCKIADKVMIGMGAIVLSGVEIPENVIIAAGAVVPENKKLEPNSIYMGVPAEKTREVRPREEGFIVENATGYWELAQSYIQK
jgi:carbonic anhydrase/acetyltransferase-like protein (isoleucine patch superfamily)